MEEHAYSLSQPEPFPHAMCHSTTQSTGHQEAHLQRKYISTASKPTLGAPKAMKKGIDIFNPKLVFPGNPPEAAPNTTQPEQPIHPAAQESLQHPANSQQDWQFASLQDSESGAPLMGSTRGDDDNEQDANATTSPQRQQICGYCSKSFGRNRDYK
ncbi:hypothetical protein AK830_g12004 [Neonectria ditissima]|uniref:Uncharacterized protein n=1 Tax=Neonectria ditissima TaxID=78410 RepID=A0A0P7AQ91_9HYPO|nr:hypothetical protein AK830_g12004 [Neonectria ditissima]